jgi:hypothetical protein
MKIQDLGLYKEVDSNLDERELSLSLGQESYIDRNDEIQSLLDNYGTIVKNKLRKMLIKLEYNCSDFGELGGYIKLEYVRNIIADTMGEILEEE